MEIKRVFERDEQLISSLVTVWESSIRATHDFFSETNIREIKKYVFQAIEETGPTHVTVGEFFIVSTGERTRFRFYRTGRENNTLALFYRELEIPRHI